MASIFALLFALFFLLGYDNAATARLLRLHIEEKTVREAQEWPVDLSFFSAIGGLVLMTLGRVIVELVMRMFL